MMTRSAENIADIKTAVLPNGYRPAVNGSRRSHP
jgi:hypothetical protein